jgi:hypothetical protein
LTNILVILLLTKCSTDCLETYNVFEKIETRSEEELLLINEDTCIAQDTEQSTVRINGSSKLTVLGDLTITSSLILVSGGTLNVDGILELSGNAFFLGQPATINARGIIINGHVVDQGDLGGLITYCTFASIQELDPGILLVEDCEQVIQCETLSTPSLFGYRYLGTRELSCRTKNSDKFIYEIKN